MRRKTDVEMMVCRATPGYQDIKKCNNLRKPRDVNVLAIKDKKSDRKEFG
jgi:hypothetical protein